MVATFTRFFRNVHTVGRTSCPVLWTWSVLIRMNKFALFASTSLLSAGLVLGQSQNGTIAGVVTDQSGAVVSGAVVTLTTSTPAQSAPQPPPARATTTSRASPRRTTASPSLLPASAAPSPASPSPSVLPTPSTSSSPLARMRWLKSRPTRSPASTLRTRKTPR